MACDHSHVRFIGMQDTFDDPIPLFNCVGCGSTLSRNSLSATTIVHDDRFSVATILPMWEGLHRNA